MATQALTVPFFSHGGTLSPEAVEIDTGHSPAIGQAVLLVAGKIQDVAADPNKIAGIAAEAGVAGEFIKYRRIKKGDRLVLPLYSATPGAAVTARSQLHVQYGVIPHADNTEILAVDIDDAVNTRVEIVGFWADHDPVEAIGDLNGRVEVEVMEAYLQ